MGGKAIKTERLSTNLRKLKRVNTRDKLGTNARKKNEGRSEPSSNYG